MRATTAGVLLALLGACRSSPEAIPLLPPEAGGKDWCDLAVRTLRAARTLQWTVTLHGEEIADPSFLPMFSSMKISFRTKGPSRAAWSSSGVESWYTAPDLWTKVGDGLERRDFGPEEGTCILQALVKGGLVGWTLVHASWGFDEFTPGTVTYETLDGRAAAVVEHSFGLDTPGSMNPRFPGCKLWLDVRTGLPLKRTYSASRTHGRENKPFRVTETYSDWIFDAPLPDRTFMP